MYIDQKESLISKISIIDNMEESGQISLVQHTHRKSMKAELLFLAAQEEQRWKQKCKEKWISEGDINTSFFHRIMAAKRRKNTIMEILSVHGNSLLKEEEIVSEFIEFYRGLYSKKGVLTPFPDGIDLSPIDSNLADELECEFNELEVWKAVNLLGTDKSPGPDGFTLEFFKKCSNILKSDIMRVFQDFFQNGIINVGHNETYICLISKKIDAHTVDDFRPISLTTCLYKIIARVLSKRLKKVLPLTISDYQLLLSKAGKFSMHLSWLMSLLMNGKEKERREGGQLSN